MLLVSGVGATTGDSVGVAGGVAGGGFCTAPARSGGDGAKTSEQKGGRIHQIFGNRKLRTWHSTAVLKHPTRSIT